MNELVIRTWFIHNDLSLRMLAFRSDIIKNLRKSKMRRLGSFLRARTLSRTFVFLWVFVRHVTTRS